ncbi:MAG: hypothetical protein IKX70_03175 [Treponema sp.]|nr:hypothetical protein [Treponema sp.]
MKLFKKLILSLCALMLLGMITSCGGGAGGGEPSGDGYKVVYNGQILDDDLDIDEINMYIYCCQLEEDTDYSINHSTKTITLTASGKTKIDAYESAMISGESYSFKYGDMTFMSIPAGLLTAYLSTMNLVSGTDYTRNDSEHTITLTDTGYAKITGLGES